MIYQILICFFGGFLTDLLYVGWISAIGKSRVYVAGLFAVGIAACSTFSFFDMVNHRWLVVPYFIGIFAGTIIGVKIKVKLGI